MEKWRTVYTEDQIKKIQEIELKNLIVLKNVCEKLNIKFFVYGGTLIGAVRHKGFVPWDDDLDVAMMRADYDKFVAEAEKYLPNEYCLQTPYNDKNTPYLYTKLRRKGTKYIEFGHHRLKIEQGIYIDIYPIDHISDNDDENFENYRKFLRNATLYGLRQCPYSVTEGRSLVRRFKNIVRFSVGTALKLIPQKFLVKRSDRCLTKFNHVSTKRNGNLFYPKLANYFYDLLPYEEGVFEGISVFLPGNWHRHLSSRYGNYMEMPPVEERLGHKPYLLDFGDN